MSTAGLDLLRVNPRTYARTADRTIADPTLFLDFQSATALDPRITFSRGSQATLFDSTGTLKYAKHNLLLQSEDFSTTWAATGATVTTNATTAPSGSATADKLIADSAITVSPSSVSAFVRQDITKAATATTYTFSLFAKAGEFNAVRLFARDNATSANNAAVTVLLTNGTVLTAAAAGGTFTNASVAITNAGNGWYRVALTFTSSTETTIRFIYAVGDSSTTTGDASKGIFIWGAQLNLANIEGGVTSSLTTYYPTTTAAYYAPRFDYNPSTLQPRGLLIEEARTNSIRNNTMQGAVAGTPGTLPTNWGIGGGGLGTLTQQVVGTGTINGINYIDVKFSGTTSNTDFSIAQESTTEIVAANGQNWAASTWIAIVGGSTANITSIFLNIAERTSAGVFVAQQNGPNLIGSLSGTLTRYTASYTLAGGATVARIQPRFLTFSYGSGVAIDITLRIGLPQLEQGAFATSVIPTTTTALTRNADVASMTGTNFSSWYSASEGTVYVDVVSAPVNTIAQQAWYLSDGTANNAMFLRRNTSGLPAAAVLVSASPQGDISSGGAISGSATYKTAFAYKANDLAISTNANTVGTDTSANIPTVDRLALGISVASTQSLNGTIRRLAFYPQRLPNATLQALTQ